MIARVSQAIAMLLLSVAAASAQSTTGSISGTVRDQSKAILPGATVEVRNVDTGAVRSIVTDHEGRYRALRHHEPVDDAAAGAVRDQVLVLTSPVRLSSSARRSP